jgi:hypothetical protein
MVFGRIALAWALLLADPPALLEIKPTLRAPEPQGYVLHRTKDGGYTYEEDGWRVAIAPDGSVRFSDRTITLDALKLGPIHLLNGRLPQGTPTLQGWLKDLAGKHPPPDPWEQARVPISRYHADPRTACLERDPCYFVPAGTAGVPAGASGVMDLTDAYIRLMGQDPYRRAKARFLSATVDMRARMVARHETAVRRASLVELPARLDKLWSDDSHPAAEKRRLLWLLWDEARDAQGGPAARRIIERFIRERLPRGSPDAFTDEELTQFRAGPGGAFAPYDDE